jgi:glutamyl-tRNA(Gln) amidotransferase subunit E
LRVIHGKERIYPDTDTPPIVISQELVENSRKAVGKQPWEVYEELHRKYGFNQSHVDLLIRGEKVDKFYELVERLKLEGSVAYHLLIELPRSRRRKGLKMNEHMIRQLADGLSRNLIIPEQIASITKVFDIEPRLLIDEALTRLQIPHLTQEQFATLVLQKLSIFDLEKARSDEAYRKHVVPKVVGEVMKATNRSVPGKTVARKIRELLNQE